MREKHQKEEYFSFTPEINKNTNTLLKTKISNINYTDHNTSINYLKPYEMIHEKYKQRLLKLRKLEESIYSSSTFTPTTNHNIPIEKNFNERQECFKKRVLDHSEEYKIFK